MSKRLSCALASRTKVHTGELLEGRRDRDIRTAPPFKEEEQEIKDSIAEDRWDEERHGLDRWVIDGE